MKMDVRRYLFILGLFWLIAGLFLTYFGAVFICYSTLFCSYQPLLNNFVKAIGFLTGSSEVTTIVVISLAILLGITVGRKLLSKSIKKDVKAICKCGTIVSVFRFYSYGFWLYICFFIFITQYSVCLDLSYDINGFIKMVFGVSLINAAFNYLKFSFSSQLHTVKS